MSPPPPAILCAGEDDAIAETRSLPPMGVVGDTTSLAAGHVVARLRAERPGDAVAHRDGTRSRDTPGVWHRSAPTGHDRCPHVEGRRRKTGDEIEPPRTRTI